MRILLVLTIDWIEFDIAPGRASEPLKGETTPPVVFVVVAVQQTAVKVTESITVQATAVDIAGKFVISRIPYAVIN